MTFLADQPELMALASLAVVAPSKLALAFNDPLAIFAHLSLDELHRIQGACERLGSLTAALAEAMDVWTEAARVAVSEAT
jgi:hypothetical protein